MIRHMNEELKRFLNFTDCGVLFHSTDKQQLFTITENNDDEDDDDFDQYLNTFEPIEGQDLD